MLKVKGDLSVKATHDEWRKFQAFVANRLNNKVSQVLKIIENSVEISKEEFLEWENKIDRLKAIMYELLDTEKFDEFCALIDKTYDRIEGAEQ